ncbi:putative WD40 repeat protein [Trypanosoma cruzi]|nr:putative WD40 repeat protein [Trypanosoma cruzi]
MNTGAQNIFLDQDGQGEERGPSAYVKRFGGERPREMNGLLPDSLPSSSSYVLSPENTLCSGNGPQRFLFGMRFVGSRGTPVSKQNFGRKDKRLLPLMCPKDEEAFLQTLRKPTSSVEYPQRDYDGDDDDLNATEAVDDDASAVQQGGWTQPLEERFSLDELRHLMCFFSVDADYLENGMLGPKADANRRPFSRNITGKTFMVRNCSSLSRLSGGGKKMENTERHSQVEERENLCEERPQEHSSGVFIGPPGGAYQPVQTEEELQRALFSSDGLNQGSGHDAYTRVLSEQEFAQAIKIVIPSATDAEIIDLMRKVDYEAKGCTTWDDFSTFLVSQSRHRSHLANGPISELSTTPEPSYCFSHSQHITGTCMEADTRRKLLLTGGSEGTVRAWDLETLTSRGIVFAGDCWVVGVHWANQIQSILIVTMDRRVIVLDSKTLEVKRLYRGRALVDNIDGYMYAHDSVQSVKVGGKIKAKEKRFGPKGARDLFGAASTSSSGVGGSPVAYPVKQHSSESKRKMPTAATALAPPGTGPYVQCRVEECMLAGLVDSVSCSLFHHSMLREEVILIATVVGEVRFYVIPKALRRVVSPYAVVQLHEKRINKMSILFDSNALLTASDDGVVKMTSLDTGVLLRTFFTSGSEQHSAVHDFAVNTQLRLLVTVGPERYGIVWDFSHDAPLAILDAHNSPCRCCAVHIRQKQIFTVGIDGTIFVFDTHGYRLTQVIHVHHLHPQCVVYDEKKMRLLCLASHPYYHGKQLSAAFACSNKYQGNMASMVGMIYNKTYDLIVTIDLEGLVMTWKRSNGAPVFAFQLKDFSDSVVMNAARLSSFALDGLGRRLLTGFQNGAVAVWNLVNGQTTNVITAATESFATTTLRPEVTSLESLTRDGTTFFFFAAAGHLFSTRESGTFTIASANKWEVPAVYGDILSMLPVSLQILACGTSSGALIFYHFLAERQVGSALWVTEPTESMHRSISFSSEKHRSDAQASVLTSRIIAMFPLHAVGPHTLMSVYADGTVALWHTLRRLLMDSVSLRTAFPAGRGETGLAHVAIDECNQCFVFADDRGDIHVCNLQLQAVNDPGSMRPARTPQLKGDAERPMAHWPGSPFSNYGFVGKSLSLKAKGKNDVAGQPNENQQQKGLEHEVDVEKTLYVFLRFCQEYVFHCGFPSVSGVSIVKEPTRRDPRGVTTASTATETPLPIAKGAEVGEQACGSVSEGEAEHFSGNYGPTSDAGFYLDLTSSTASAGIIVVSSGSDNFTRVFTLTGTIIGECGMNIWILGKESTYEFLGVKPTRRLPARGCSVQAIDFLQETPKGEKSHPVGSRGLRLTRGTSKVGKILRDSFSGSELSTSHPIADTTELWTSPTTRFPPSAPPSGATPEINPLEYPSMHPKGAEVREFGNRKKEDSHAKDRLLRRFLPKATTPFEEAGVLSTHIHSRRLKEENIQGIVKSEFISRLRGLPVNGSDEDSVAHRTPLAFERNPRGGVHAEPSSESFLSAPGVNNHNSINTNNHSGLTNGTAVVNSLPEETFTPLDTRNHVPPVFVVGGLSHSGRMAKAQAGAVAWKGDLPAANDIEVTQSPVSCALRHNAFSALIASPVEDEAQRQDLIQEHMEAQRRMLLALGRKDSVLGTALSRRSSRHSSVSPAEKMGKTTGTQLLETLRIQSLGMMETRDRIARITARLHLAPVSPIAPPSVIREREGDSPLKDGRKNTHSAAFR